MTFKHEKSSGNVFADLGLPFPEQDLVKAKLTVQIYRLLKERGLKQTEAAKLLQTTQAQISGLMRCKPASISIEKLMGFLTILGQNIEVTVTPTAKGKPRVRTGKVSVTVHSSF